MRATFSTCTAAAYGLPFGQFPFDRVNRSRNWGAKTVCGYFFAFAKSALALAWSPCFWYTTPRFRQADT